MSGGYYGYAYMNDVISTKIKYLLEDLSKETDHYLTDAANEASSMLSELDALEAKWHQFKEVARAYEWYKSYDYSADQVHEAAQEWRSR